MFRYFNDNGKEVVKRGIIIILLLILICDGLNFSYLKLHGKSQNTSMAGDHGSAALVNDYSNFEESEQIDNTIDRFMKMWLVKGMSVAIVKNEKLVFAKGYGFADEENKIKVTPSHVFRIASVSKLITATAIMKLCESGKLRLDDKVFGSNGILNQPQYLNYKDKRMEMITIKNLLNHSGGWSQRYGDPMFNSLDIAKKVGDKAPATIDTYLKFVLSRNLQFTPGTTSCYSNMGYVILSKVIEKVSGVPYEEYVKTQLFDPIGIRDVHIGHTCSSDHFINEVKYYEQEGSNMVPSCFGNGKMVKKSDGGNNIELLSSAGGWVTTAAELAKFVTAIDGVGENDIISPKSVKTMTQYDPVKGPLGWKSVGSDGTWWRTGSMPGTSAVVKHMPDGTEWVVLMNTSSWKGPRFPRYVDTMISHILQKIDSWPQHNLFDYMYHASKLVASKN
ncbi:MAG: serine hydrolase domain-containing protein [Bacteroidota bacterium]|nr:serine hydrolase domain-containing protein [Bacteroidota bacterium]MDP4204898.1 serine hydrolase domain-containing protein [Bacteroidota bacterium]